MGDETLSPKREQELEAGLLALPAGRERAAAAGALAEDLGAPVLPLLERLIGGGWLHWGPLIGSLRRLGPPAVPLLKRFVTLDPWPPGPVIHLLADVGTDEDVREACLAVFERDSLDDLFHVLQTAVQQRDPALDAAVLQGCLSPQKKRRAAFARGAAFACSGVPPLLRDRLGSEDRAERLAAAEALQHVGDHPEAEGIADALLARLGKESDPTVRDTLRSTIRTLRVPASRVRAAFPRRSPEEITMAAARVKKLPGSFLDEAGLPPLLDCDGSPLPPAMIRYLLHRQSREPDPQPDIEALDVYDAIDRSTSGDFALHVLEAALAAKPTKRTAWAFITAGMLGDRRVVAALSTQLPNWVKKNKNALPEFAAAALGLVGDDLALSVLVGLADEHREPASDAKTLLRDTAERALSAAAAERGILREELDEAVLPAFGFPLDGSARVIPAGLRTIEARIGADFRLALTDADTGKRAASIPKAAGEEAQAEFKGLRKILQGVFKQQARRLERLMVDGHAWDAGRWSDRFLGHPVLVPLSQRLVWGVPDASGAGYAALFRGLGDGTLTDSEDEEVPRPTEGTVALAHPARMTAEQLDAWTEHAADYEVEQPFEQLHRFRAAVPPELAGAAADPRTEGGEVNAFSLRGKLQKHGWVQDGNRWARRFPADGVTAALGLDGGGYDFYYLSAEDTVKVGTLSFARAKEPIPLGEVPVVPYSESAGLVLRTLGR